MRLTVGTWNIERLGWSKGDGHARLGAAVEWLLEQTPTPPDVLALPEATHILPSGQDLLRRQLVYPLAGRLTDGWYEPFYASRGLPGEHNHYHLLLVNTSKVRPLGWHDPSLVLGASHHLAGFLEAEIAGHTVKICCEHWPGGQGRAAFDAAAARVSTHGGPSQPTLLLGDFNATSSWEREHMPADWYAHCEQRSELHKLEQKGWWDPSAGRWEVDTRQLDKLRLIYGFRDLGEVIGDPTPTTHPDEGSGLRIDRVVHSAGWPGDPVEYRVHQPPRALSDHALVAGAYRLEPTGSPGAR